MYGVIIGDLILNGKCTSNTVLTVAIADAIKNNIKYSEAIKMYIERYKDITYSDFEWKGKLTDVNFLNFVSPIGFICNNEFDIAQNIKKIAKLNRNIDMINIASYMSLIILYIRKGISMEEIYRQLCIDLKYIESPISIKDTFSNVLYNLYNATYYEQTIIKSHKEEVPIISPMAEALFGIPDYLKENKEVPSEFVKALRR